MIEQIWSIKVKVDGKYEVGICDHRSVIEFLWEKLEKKGIYRLHDSQDILVKRK